MGEFPHKLTDEERAKGRAKAAEVRAERAKSFRQRLAERVDAKADEVADVFFDAMGATSAYLTKDGELVLHPDYAVRVRAAVSAADQAYGKPKEAVELSGPDGEAIPVEHKARLTLGDVADLAAELGLGGSPSNELPAARRVLSDPADG